MSNQTESNSYFSDELDDENSQESSQENCQPEMPSQVLSAMASETKNDLVTLTDLITAHIAECDNSNKSTRQCPCDCDNNQYKKLSETFYEFNRSIQQRLNIMNAEINSIQQSISKKQTYGWHCVVGVVTISCAIGWFCFSKRN